MSGTPCTARTTGLLFRQHWGYWGGRKRLPFARRTPVESTDKLSRRTRFKTTHLEIGDRSKNSRRELDLVAQSSELGDEPATPFLQALGCVPASLDIADALVEYLSD